MSGLARRSVVGLLVTAVAMAVSAAAAAPTLATETPHVRIAAPRSSNRRTLIFSGATTAEFPNLRAYWEHGQAAQACAPTFADRPRLAQEWGWNDIAPPHEAGLVAFERKETVHEGTTGELHIVCAYLEDRSGHVGARAHLSYRDPALR